MRYLLRGAKCVGRHPSAVVREERDLLVVGGLGEARLGRWHLSDPFVCRDWGNLRWEELCEEGHVGEVLPMVVEWGGGWVFTHPCQPPGARHCAVAETERSTGPSSPGEPTALQPETEMGSEALNFSSPAASDQGRKAA